MTKKIIIRWNTYILITFSLFLLSGCISGGDSGSSGGVGATSGVSTLNGFVPNNSSSGNDSGGSDSEFVSLSSFSGNDSSEDSSAAVLALEEALSENSSSDINNDLGGQAFSFEILDRNESGESIARIHNPEPATMFLFGSGMMAFGIYKKRRNSR